METPAQILETGGLSGLTRQAPHPSTRSPLARKDRFTSPTRASLLGHRSAVLWLTGLSGAGKSTLAAALEQRLLARGLLASVIDGDSLRTGLSKNLGYTAEERRENLRRATELALHLAEAGVIVVVALISPFRADRMGVAERLKEKGIPFAEVFVNTPLAVCELRDPKGLYRKARRGEIKSFTGFDSPYEAPLNPDLELRTDLESVEQSLEKLSRRALDLALDEIGLRRFRHKEPCRAHGFY